MEIHPRSDDELDQWVALLNLGDPAPKSVDDAVRLEAAPAGDVHARPALSGVVDGDVVAIGEARPVFGGPRGWYAVLVKVAPTYRGRGLGDVMLEAVHDALASEQPPGLQVSARDDDPRSRTWAEARGFDLWAHRFQSSLDVSHADLSELERLEAEAAASGYRIIQPSPDDDRRLFELSTTLLMDAPDLDGGEPPSWELFEHSRRTLVDRAGTFVVTHGDEWVGLSELFVIAEGERYTAFTGVASGHRGRRLAELLKLKAIACCREAGIGVMRTNNLSINAPILALNRRLGYVQEPGVWVLRRDVTTTTPHRDRRAQ
ncbi:MAG TPA: GNAT family N-acetyltransferase [Acidimicrobiales bacterium]|nr:GNAT family N-acetyltransferase [Acidimicrobiales bacterium]